MWRDYQVNILTAVDFWIVIWRMMRWRLLWLRVVLIGYDDIVRMEVV